MRLKLEKELPDEGAVLVDYGDKMLGPEGVPLVQQASREELEKVQAEGGGSGVGAMGVAGADDGELSGLLKLVRLPASEASEGKPPPPPSPARAAGATSCSFVLLGTIEDAQVSWANGHGEGTKEGEQSVTICVYSFRRWQRRRRKKSAKAVPMFGGTAKCGDGGDKSGMYGSGGIAAEMERIKALLPNPVSLSLEECGGSRRRQAKRMLQEKKPYTFVATPPVPLRFATQNKLVAWEIEVEDKDAKEGEDKTYIVYPDRIGAGLNYDAEYSSDW
jgi:hypothetical protein